MGTKQEEENSKQTTDPRDYQCLMRRRKRNQRQKETFQENWDVVSKNPRELVAHEFA